MSCNRCLTKDMLRSTSITSPTMMRIITIVTVRLIRRTSCTPHSWIAWVSPSSACRWKLWIRRRSDATRRSIWVMTCPTRNRSNCVRTRSMRRFGAHSCAEWSTCVTLQPTGTKTAWLRPAMTFLVLRSASANISAKCKQTMMNWSSSLRHSLSTRSTCEDSRYQLVWLKRCIFLLSCKHAYLPTHNDCI